MGLDIWFSQDVSRILAATQETMVAYTNAVAVIDDKEQTAYQQGFFDAIQAIAIAFGIATPGALQARPQPWQRDF